MGSAGSTPAAFFNPVMWTGFHFNPLYVRSLNDVLDLQP